MPLPERQLISRIRRSSKDTSGEVVKGIGDDCAVLRIPRGHETVVTTDFSIEGVHFRREWHTPESIGHRCLARGLSDVAAMGAQPVAAFLSLALPDHVSQKWVDRFMLGFTRLCERFDVVLAGGDTAQSPDGVAADIVVLGSVPRGKAVLRSGARVGDDIYVTGLLGASAATLRELFNGRSVRPSVRSRPHFFPEPRVVVGQFLQKNKLASAMIDLSDGLSVDLNHICEESGVGAWVSEAAIPHDRPAVLADALHGGEDYELLFTARPEKHNLIPEEIDGVPITYIGTIIKDKGVWLVARDMQSRQPLEPKGWQHFGD